MKKKFKAAFLTLIFVAIVALLFIYLSTHDIAVLDPKGMIGLKERDLIYTSALLMLIVVIPVFILTFWFAWRYRETNEKARHEPDWEHNYIAEYCWWGVPFVIIVVLAAITWRSSHELNPFKPIQNGKTPIEIQVVALDWKWLFIYPNEGIATVNYIQFPIDTPINFEITADAPMNSFWIPQLGGQIYAMPAMRSKLHLIANELGNYRGVSANISGRGFAGMTFQAVATTEEQYYAWIEGVKSSGSSLNMVEYNQLLTPSENNPVELYNLAEMDLFEQILMKYMAPTNRQ